MKYFEQFTSNSYAGSSNQFYFNMNEGEVRTGRIYYKISVGGEYNYSILFSNIIDSTYADGSLSHMNLICDEWKIHSLKIGKCSEFPEDINAGIYVTDFKEATFDGKKEKKGNIFSVMLMVFFLGLGYYMYTEKPVIDTGAIIERMEQEIHRFIDFTISD